MLAEQAAAPGGETQSATPEAVPPAAAPDPIAAAREVLSELKAEQAEFDRLRNLSGSAQEPSPEEVQGGNASAEAKSTPGQPEGTKPAPKEAEAKKEDPVSPEDRRRLEARHQREMRARDRAVQESRTQAEQLQRQNKELADTLEELKRDPIGFLAKNGADLTQVGKALVEKHADKVLAKPKDPQQERIDRLEAELNRLVEERTKETTSRKEQEEQATAKAQKEKDWRTVVDVVTQEVDKYPFINALAGPETKGEGVQMVIDTYYDHVKNCPEEVATFPDAQSHFQHVLKSVEDHLKDWETKRFSRLSSLMGAAPGAQAGDGQKKPAPSGQRNGKGSSALSSEGSEPQRGGTQPRELNEEEKLERMLAALKSRTGAA